ncbi:MAG: hypothetical protein JKY46_08715 [Robiginitomaculum sp.]|nr:hypothetical protein [Robiginitomaculum sp.]
MASLEQKIKEIEARTSRLSESEVEARRQHIEDFMAISAFEGLLPSALSLRLQKSFAAEKLTPTEYIALCQQYSGELRA